ncbi:hypothetical protein MASR1M49_04580 [Pararhodobacter aggregans]
MQDVQLGRSKARNGTGRHQSGRAEDSPEADTKRHMIPLLDFFPKVKDCAEQTAKSKALSAIWHPQMTEP